MTKLFISTIILFSTILIGLTMCNNIPLDNKSTSGKFNREVWLANNNVADTKNPRANMVDDLLKNYLHSGIRRDSILYLLGKPYKDGIENRLQKAIKEPDSLLAHMLSETFNKDKALKDFNDWHSANSQPDTLMLYPVGWSLIDPNFLVIKFRPDSVAYEFWVEQH